MRNSNYSMFSNESNESLNTTSNTEPNEKSSIHTMTESVTEDTTSPISPSSIKLNFSMMKKSQSMISSSSSSKDSSVGSVIARDKSLQSFTQALIHAEPDIDGTNGAGYKKDQENIYEVVDNGGPKSIELVDITPAKKSDSSYTFQSYDCR